MKEMDDDNYLEETIEDYNYLANLILPIINEIIDSNTANGKVHLELQRYINLLIAEINIMQGDNFTLAKKAKSKLIEYISLYLITFE